MLGFILGNHARKPEPYPISVEEALISAIVARNYGWTPWIANAHEIIGVSVSFAGMEKEGGVLNIIANMLFYKRINAIIKLLN